jgi:hypothetical protein
MAESQKPGEVCVALRLRLTVTEPLSSPAEVKQAYVQFPRLAVVQRSLSILRCRVLLWKGESLDRVFELFLAAPCTDANSA